MSSAPSMFDKCVLPSAADLLWLERLLLGARQRVVGTNYNPAHVNSPVRAAWRNLDEEGCRRKTQIAGAP